MRNRNKGFTLIELMITVAIVAILAAIAIPNYSDYVQRSRRNEAMQALHATKNAMEKFRLGQNQYPTTITILNGVTTSHGLRQSGTDWLSENGNYTVSIAIGSGGNATGVAAVAGADQASDTDCRIFMLNLNGTKLARNSSMAVTTDQCWRD